MISIGKCEASSHSITWGVIAPSANSRMLRRSCCCSSVNEKSTMILCRPGFSASYSRPKFGLYSLHEAVGRKDWVLEDYCQSEETIAGLRGRGGNKTKKEKEKRKRKEKREKRKDNAETLRALKFRREAKISQRSCERRAECRRGA